MEGQIFLHVMLFAVWVVGVCTNAWLDAPEKTSHYNFMYKEYGGRLKFLTFLNGVSQKCVPSSLSESSRWTKLVVCLPFFSWFLNGSKLVVYRLSFSDFSE